MFLLFLLQSEKGVSYAPEFSFGICRLGVLIMFRNVLNVVLVHCLFRSLMIVSVVPYMYGRVVVFMFSSLLCVILFPTLYCIYFWV